MGLSISGKIGARQTFTLVHGLFLYGLIYGKIKPNTDLIQSRFPFLFPQSSGPLRECVGDR